MDEERRRGEDRLLHGDRSENQQDSGNRWIQKGWRVEDADGVAPCDTVGGGMEGRAGVDGV